MTNPRHRPAAFVNPELLVAIALLAAIAAILIPVVASVLNK